MDNCFFPEPANDGTRKKATTKPSVALPPDLEEALKDLPADQRDAVKHIIDKQMSCSCKNHYAFR
jgi:hypothetical protein